MLVQLKESVEVIDFAVALGQSVEKAKLDGKIDVTDIAYFMDPLMKLVPAVENIKAVKEEMLNASAEAKQELVAHFKAKLDIADDKLEMVIEESFALAIAVSNLVAAIKK